MRCIIFHRNQKIFEFSPPTASSHAPTILFGIFGDHAYFYNNGKQFPSNKSNRGITADALDAPEGGEGAAKTSVTYDEFSNRRIREPFAQIGDHIPPLSEWRGGYDLMEAMKTGFNELKELAEQRKGPKRRRYNDADRQARDSPGQSKYYCSCDLNHSEQTSGTSFRGSRYTEDCIEVRTL